jgi:hypothetical protein
MSAKLTKDMWDALKGLEIAADNWCSKCDYNRCDGCEKLKTIGKLTRQMHGISAEPVYTSDVREYPND